MLAPKSLYIKRELKEITRLYEQTLCQSHYTHLSYTILTVYKFLLTTPVVPHVKRVSFFAFPLPKKTLVSRHLLFTHFLFLFFHKDLGSVALQKGANYWHLPINQAGLGFYLLRYQLWPEFQIYPFVPGRQWHQCNPRDRFSLDFRAFVEADDEFFERKPLLEDYLSIDYEEEYRYRLGGQLRCEVPAGLPAWYGKVFALRSFHYPVTYSNRLLLRPLELLSQVPLKQAFLFDEASDAEYSMDRKKQQLLSLYSILLNWGESGAILTEYLITKRLTEQLCLPGSIRKAAAAFRKVWRAKRGLTTRQRN